MNVYHVYILMITQNRFLSLLPKGKVKNYFLDFNSGYKELVKFGNLDSFLPCRKCAIILVQVLRLDWYAPGVLTLYIYAFDSWHRVKVMRVVSVKEIGWMTVLTILCIACFPANPLVLTGLLEPAYYLPAFITGWVVWAIGMALVIAPVVMFPRRGGVTKGKSFVHTTRLVDSGIYAVVSHPQYLGGILAIFVATLLLYPHWLFAVLGISRAIMLHLSVKEEEKRLIERFGNNYRAYVQKVPGMNLISGVIRLRRRQKQA